MLKHQEKAGKPKAQKSQEAHQHPLEKVKLGDVGFRFKKYFGHHHNGWTLRSERETSRVVVHLYFLSLCLCNGGGRRDRRRRRRRRPEDEKGRQGR